MKFKIFLVWLFLGLIFGINATSACVTEGEKCTISKDCCSGNCSKSGVCTVESGNDDSLLGASLDLNPASSKAKVSLGPVSLGIGGKNEAKNKNGLSVHNGLPSVKGGVKNSKSSIPKVKASLGPVSLGIGSIENTNNHSGSSLGISGSFGLGSTSPKASGNTGASLGLGLPSTKASLGVGLPGVGASIGLKGSTGNTGASLGLGLPGAKSSLGIGLPGASVSIGTNGSSGNTGESLGLGLPSAKASLGIGLPGVGASFGLDGSSGNIGTTLGLGLAKTSTSTGSNALTGNIGSSLRVNTTSKASVGLNVNSLKVSSSESTLPLQTTKASVPTVSLNPFSKEKVGSSVTTLNPFSGTSASNHGTGKESTSNCAPVNKVCKTDFDCCSHTCNLVTQKCVPFGSYTPNNVIRPTRKTNEAKSVTESQGQGINSKQNTEKAGTGQSKIVNKTAVTGCLKNWIGCKEDSDCCSNYCSNKDKKCHHWRQRKSKVNGTKIQQSQGQTTSAPPNAKCFWLNQKCTKDDECCSKICNSEIHQCQNHRTIIKTSTSTSSYYKSWFNSSNPAQINNQSLRQQEKENKQIKNPTEEYDAKKLLENQWNHITQQENELKNLEKEETRQFHLGKELSDQNQTNAVQTEERNLGEKLLEEHHLEGQIKQKELIEGHQMEQEAYKEGLKEAKATEDKLKKQENENKILDNELNEGQLVESQIEAEPESMKRDIEEIKLKEDEDKGLKWKKKLKGEMKNEYGRLKQGGAFLAVVKQQLDKQKKYISEFVEDQIEQHRLETSTRNKNQSKTEKKYEEKKLEKINLYKKNVENNLKENELQVKDEFKGEMKLESKENDKQLVSGLEKLNNDIKNLKKKEIAQNVKEYNIVGQNQTKKNENEETKLGKEITKENHEDNTIKGKELQERHQLEDNIYDKTINYAEKLLQRTGKSLKKQKEEINSLRKEKHIEQLELDNLKEKPINRKTENEEVKLEKSRKKVDERIKILKQKEIKEKNDLENGEIFFSDIGKQIVHPHNNIKDFEKVEKVKKVERELEDQLENPNIIEKTSEKEDKELGDTLKEEQRLEEKLKNNEDQVYSEYKYASKPLISKKEVVKELTKQWNKLIKEHAKLKKLEKKEVGKIITDDKLMMKNQSKGVEDEERKIGNGLMEEHDLKEDLKGEEIRAGNKVEEEGYEEALKNNKSPFVQIELELKKLEKEKEDLEDEELKENNKEKELKGFPQTKEVLAIDDMEKPNTTDSEKELELGENILKEYHFKDGLKDDELEIGHHLEDKTINEGLKEAETPVAMIKGEIEEQSKEQNHLDNSVLDDRRIELKLEKLPQTNGIENEELRIKTDEWVKLNKNKELKNEENEEKNKLVKSLEDLNKIRHQLNDQRDIINEFSKERKNQKELENEMNNEDDPEKLKKQGEKLEQTIIEEQNLARNLKRNETNVKDEIMDIAAASSCLKENQKCQINSDCCSGYCDIYTSVCVPKAYRKAYDYSYREGPSQIVRYYRSDKVCAKNFNQCTKSSDCCSGFCDPSTNICKNFNDYLRKLENWEKWKKNIKEFKTEKNLLLGNKEKHVIEWQRTLETLSELEKELEEELKQKKINNAEENYKRYVKDEIKKAYPYELGYGEQKKLEENELYNDLEHQEKDKAKLEEIEDYLEDQKANKIDEQQLYYELKRNEQKRLEEHEIKKELEHQEKYEINEHKQFGESKPFLDNEGMQKDYDLEENGQKELKKYDMDKELENEMKKPKKLDNDEGIYEEYELNKDYELGQENKWRRESGHEDRHGLKNQEKLDELNTYQKQYQRNDDYDYELEDEIKNWESHALKNKVEKGLPKVEEEKNLGRVDTFLTRNKEPIIENYKQTKKFKETMKDYEENFKNYVKQKEAEKEIKEQEMLDKEKLNKATETIKEEKKKDEEYREFLDKVIENSKEMGNKELNKDIRDEKFNNKMEQEVEDLKEGLNDERNWVHGILQLPSSIKNYITQAWSSNLETVKENLEKSSEEKIKLEDESKQLETYYNDKRKELEQGIELAKGNTGKNNAELKNEEKELEDDIQKKVELTKWEPSKADEYYEKIEEDYSKLKELKEEIGRNDNKLKNYEVEINKKEKDLERKQSDDKRKTEEEIRTIKNKLDGDLENLSPKDWIPYIEKGLNDKWKQERAILKMKEERFKTEDADNKNAADKLEEYRKNLENETKNMEKKFNGEESMMYNNQEKEKNNYAKHGGNVNGNSLNNGHIVTPNDQIQAKNQNKKESISHIINQERHEHNSFGNLNQMSHTAQLNHQQKGNKNSLNAIGNQSKGSHQRTISKNRPNNKVEGPKRIRIAHFVKGGIGKRINNGIEGKNELNNNIERIVNEDVNRIGDKWKMDVQNEDEYLEKQFNDLKKGEYDLENKLEREIKDYQIDKERNKQEEKDRIYEENKNENKEWMIGKSISEKDATEDLMNSLMNNYDKKSADNLIDKDYNLNIKKLYKWRTLEKRIEELYYLWKQKIEWGRENRLRIGANKVMRQIVENYVHDKLLINYLQELKWYNLDWEWIAYEDLTWNMFERYLVRNWQLQHRGWRRYRGQLRI